MHNPFLETTSETPDEVLLSSAQCRDREALGRLFARQQAGWRKSGSNLHALQSFVLYAMRGAWIPRGAANHR